MRVAPAPTLQSRPIRTFGPIAAPGPITLPDPISAPGPIVAPGSTWTFSSSRASGWTCAPGETPRLPKSEAGRIASG